MESSAVVSAESWISFFWWFKLAAAFLVTIGVGMEFGGDWLARPYEKTVEDARKLEIERLKNENLSLEAAVSPRILEQNLTAKALAPYADVSFLVLSPSDLEPKKAAGQIRFMLLHAGWKRFSKPFAQQFAFFDGVVVHSTISQEARDARDALVSVLTDNGIVARSGYPLTIGNPAENPSDPVLAIVVGPKPLPASLQIKPEDIPANAAGGRMYGNIVE